MERYNYEYNDEENVYITRKQGKRSGRVMSIHVLLWAIEKSYLADQKRKQRKAEKLNQQEQ